jgi:hypothetical protein
MRQSLQDDWPPATPAASFISTGRCVADLLLRFSACRNAAFSMQAPTLPVFQGKKLFDEVGPLDVPLAGKRVGVLRSGGNVELERLAELLKD